MLLLLLLLLNQACIRSETNCAITPQHLNAPAQTTTCVNAAPMRLREVGDVTGLGSSTRLP
jgi:hypothetical protein